MTTPKEHEFKQIRNKIRRRIRDYYPLDIISACVENLYRPDLWATERLTYIQPWLLLLVIKWTISESLGNTLKRRRLRNPDMVDIVNMVHDLEIVTPSPLDNGDATLFLRRFAIQQFWMQERTRFSMARYARQYLIFGALDKRSKLYREFENKTHVKLEDFILLMLATTAYYLDAKTRAPMFNPKFLAPLEKAFGEQTLNNFFDCISADLLSIRKYIEQREKHPMYQHVVEAEFYEKSPLLRYPFLRDQGRLLCYSPDILIHSFESFIYDLFRETDAEQFMQEFGGMFQRYVDRILTQSKLSILREKDIQKHLNPDQRSVDFIILEEDAAILIDAKGVEMSFAARTAKSSKELEYATKDSVIKGMRQAYSTVYNIHQNPSATLSLEGKKLYLVIVTFKELVVGNGRVFYNAIGRNEIEKLASQYGDNYLVPVENMFFLGIDEFEEFIDSYAQVGEKLSLILDRIIKLDEIPGNANVYFGRSLHNVLPNLRIPKFLDDEFLRLMQKLGEALNEKPDY